MQNISHEGNFPATQSNPTFCHWVALLVVMWVGRKNHACSQNIIQGQAIAAFRKKMTEGPRLEDTEGKGRECRNWGVWSSQETELPRGKMRKSEQETSDFRERLYS